MTKSHKTTLALSAIAAMVVMVVAVAPLATNVDAVKTEQPEKCLGDPKERADCPGHSERGAQREQQECKVFAGSKDKIVEGQQKKECPP